MIMNANELAIIFPGQSSQHIGMLSDFSNHYTLVKETCDEVSELLSYDIWKLIQFGPVNQLNETYYAQPSVLITSVIIWKIWRKQGGLLPSIMAGHSLGEYSALVCAESIDLLSAVKLVKIRAMLMQKAAPLGFGAMSLIIGLDDHIIIDFCKFITSEFNQIVAPSAFNASKNIVISGQKEAVKQVNLLCKKAGAKYVLMLPISVPSHCDLMKPIINNFQIALEKLTIHPPNIPIINNADVQIALTPEIIRSALIRQLYMPVRWTEIMQKIINKKIKRFLEIGPGKVLTRLIRYSDYDDIISISVNDMNSLSEAIKIYFN